MKTKQRVLLALLAAAVLLGAALWAVTRSNEKAEQAASAAAEGGIQLCRRGLGADRVHL